VPFFIDPIEALIVRGEFVTPREGAVVRRSDGTEARWISLRAGDRGTFESELLVGGYAFFTVESPVDRVVLLEASGHAMVYVNGVPRAGDPYSYGFLRLPMELRQGANELLFAVPRGRLKVEFSEPPAAVFCDLADVTSPHLRPRTIGAVAREVGIPVYNATTRPISATLSATHAGKSVGHTVTEIPPLSVRKTPLKVGFAADQAEQTPIELTLAPDGFPPQALTLTLPTAREDQVEKVTFRSDIDDSVQYFAVVHPTAAPGPGREAGVVLSLHGASVEATSQAAAYGRKEDLFIVCPTNRRPFGFDWEDWGRLDALEVLNRFIADNFVNQERVYLTGHSMGGHGTWQLGAHFPGLFAAIAPSAGWISFDSYTPAATQPATSPVTDSNPQATATEVFRRARAASDTLALKENFHALGIYVLHGDADDNVPVSEARRMAEELKDHPDFTLHEQKGAGHWWDDSDAPGAACVDWPGIFELFGRRTRLAPWESPVVKFVTISPTVNASHPPISILAQHQSMALSRVELELGDDGLSITGRTRNVRAMAILRPPDSEEKPLKLHLDDSEFVVGPEHEKREIVLLNHEGGWRIGSLDEARSWKIVSRDGPFKNAFNRRFLLVYGTSGTEEENDWARNKARFDAETWYVRGNGTTTVMPDTDFDAEKHGNRNVILYGHRDMNRAWGQLVQSDEVDIGRGSIRVGSQAFQGDDLGCLFVVPSRLGIPWMVGVIAGTGIKGLRATNRLPIFVSGVGFPDWTVFRAGVFEVGMGGVMGAGFFGPNWEFVAKESFIAPEARSPR
jgi:dienelactone hydrolase